MTRGIVVGAIATLVVLALAVYLGIEAGMMPANADGKPFKLERWAARTSLHATLSRETPTGTPAIPSSDANLIAGIRLYAANCAICHGASDGERSVIAGGLYQHPPQFAKHGVEDDPEGETYWKVDHGIRFTGMPAFGKALGDQRVWQLTIFLKHMDGLPPAPQRVWKAVKSVALPPA
jgi:thiosulfate dehydrogenase